MSQRLTAVLALPFAALLTSASHRALDGPSHQHEATLAAPTGGPENWPAWRGANMDGLAMGADLPLRFGEGHNVRWKVQIPGRGASTPIIWGDMILLQTAVPIGEELEVRQALADWQGDGSTVFKDLSYVPATKQHRFVLLALDRATGHLRWQRVLRQEQPHEGMHPTNTWASGSPTTDGQRIIAFFGSRGVYALDMSGTVLWERDFGDMNTRNGWGEGTSATLYGDSVVVPWDHEGQSLLIVLDAATGEERWRRRRDEESTWYTPLVVQHESGAQVITTGANKVRGYDLATGELLWWGPGLTLNTIPTPLYGDGRVYLTSGFGGTVMLAVDIATARGEITTQGALVWRHDRDTPYVSSPLLLGDTLYFTKHLRGIITALDARTGAVIYGPERLPSVGEIYASPVATEAAIFLASRDGHVLVLRPGDELDIVANNEFDDGFDASPAVVGNEMYLRGHRFLYRIQAEERP